MRIGICDTTFARFDMASAAIDELKNNAYDLKIATVFPDDNKKYITTKLSEKIDNNSKLHSNNIKLIDFEVI